MACCEKDFSEISDVLDAVFKNKKNCAQAGIHARPVGK